MNINFIGLKTIDILCKRESLSKYKELIKTQYLSFDELRHIQNTKLKKLINYAYTNNIYYNNLMKLKNIKPNDISQVEDLYKLPVLTKDIIKNNYDKLLSTVKIRNNSVIKKTGGSTGQPLVYWISKSSESYLWGGIWRAWNVAGYSLGDKVLILAGDSLLKHGAKYQFYHLLNNWRCSDITNLDRRKISYILNDIKKHPNAMIYGYPTPIYLLAVYILENNLKPKVNNIVTTSEMLFDEHRKIIEKAFNCKVFDMYGANDGGIAAFECEKRNGYHINMERCIAEILDNSKQRVLQKDVGKIILTDLENYAMPFIRYEVGDLGSITNDYCGCKRGLHRLNTIHGRIKDCIHLNNGKKVDGSYFSKRFCEIQDIILFQIIQEKSREISARINIRNMNSQDLIKKINYLKNMIENDLGVDFKIVIDSNFEKNSNNKFKYILKK